MKVTKRNGRIQELSIDKISFRLKKIAKEQNLSIDTDIITIETVNSLVDNISVGDIDIITARISISHSINNPDYGKLAAGIVVSNLHKNTSSYFSECVKECNSLGLVSEELANTVEENKEILNNTINHERDYLFDYFGFKTLERSYLIKKESGEIIERPQYMWMRVSLGIHGKDITTAIETYNLMSQLYFTHASPTLFNAGTKRPAMSSCFHEDTIIATINRGPLKIKDVEIGDSVITHLGNVKKVVQLHENLLEERKFYEVDIAKTAPIKVTGNHKLYVVNYSKIKKEKSKEKNVYSIEYVRNVLNDMGCELLSTEYLNMKTKLDIVCVCKDNIQVTFENVLCNAVLCKNRECMLFRKVKGNKTKVTSEPCWKSIEELVEGDFVCIPNKINQKNHNNYLDLANFKEILDNERYTIDVKENSVTCVTKFDGYKKRYHNSINRYWKIDEDFAKFIGIFYGDGHIVTKDSDSLGVGITIHNVNKELIEFCKTIGTKIFGIEPCIHQVKNQNITQVLYNSLYIGQIFHNLFGKGFNGKKLWTEMFSWDSLLVKSLLEGLITTDGCISKSNIISLNMTNVSFMRDLYYLLRNNNIDASYGLQKRQKNGTEDFVCINIPQNCIDKDKINKCYSDNRMNVKYCAKNERSVIVNGFKFLRYNGKKEITTDLPQYVYTLGVEDDHSYNVEGIIAENCFLLECPDSMAGIYKCLSDCALISKNSGGIGIHISGVRSKGSVIKGTNGKSDGIVKMLKVFNETARFANQGSKRNGSFAIYLPCYHADIFDFLELRKNTGEETLRARDLFYALWVSDLFMESVKNDDYWYLMSEDKSIGLSDVYGDEFKNLYLKYVSEGTYVEKIKARDLWQKILVSQIETGMPYMTYKDQCNIKSNQKNAGVIKSSNLCVAPETKVLTENGYHKIKDLENKKVKVWNGEEFSETTVVKTGENQQLLRVITSDGCELECTPYHKFYIKEGEKIVKIEARFLVPEMKLAPYKFPVIRSGYDYLTLPYDIGLNFKKNPDNNCIPINCNVEMKLTWLEGFVDCNGVIEGDFLSFFLEKKYLENVKYLLNTLGCNPYIHTISISKNLYKLRLNPVDINLLLNLGLKPRVLKIVGNNESIMKSQEVYVKEVIFDIGKKDTYCFNEPKRNMGVFNGILTGNCNEITLISNTEETAVCNICTFSLPKFLEGNFFNHKKLYDVVYVAARNMNKVIDRNYYPTPEAKKSNFKLRPVAMGIQGLANLFFQLRIPFESDEARQLNREIMETIQYAAWKSSNDLSKEKCETYDRFEGSPISKGIFQHDMWGFTPTDRWDWEELKESIKKYGAMNSMMTSLPPTASTSQILGNYESFEPQNSNIFMRSTLSGDFPIVNKYLIEDLGKLNLWNESVKNEILSNKGSVQNILSIPEDIRKVYKTIWEIPQKVLLEMSRDRGYFVDQSQSLNVYMENANIAKLSSMHFYGWSLGLKTGMYYLRTRAAVSAQQFTVSPKKDLIACSIDNRDACEACSG